MTGALALLDGASPWWWLTLALALGAVELLLFTVVLLWFAAAAVVVALALLVAPDLSGAVQIALFAALSIGLTLALRGPVQRRLGGAPARPELNNRAARMTGRRAVVTEAFAGGIGAVEAEGVRWRARLAPDAAPPDFAPAATGAAPVAAPADPPLGAAVEVRGHDGPVLLVSAV